MNNKTEQPLKIAVPTLSGSRDLSQDKSGDTLVQHLQEAGHELVEGREP